MNWYICQIVEVEHNMYPLLDGQDSKHEKLRCMVMITEIKDSGIVG